MGTRFPRHGGNRHAFRYRLRAGRPRAQVKERARGIAPFPSSAMSSVGGSAISSGSIAIALLSHQENIVYTVCFTPSSPKNYAAQNRQSQKLPASIPFPNFLLQIHAHRAPRPSIILVPRASHAQQRHQPESRATVPSPQPPAPFSLDASQNFVRPNPRSPPATFSKRSPLEKGSPHTQELADASKHLSDFQKSTERSVVVPPPHQSVIVLSFKSPASPLQKGHHRCRTNGPGAPHASHYLHRTNQHCFIESALARRTPPHRCLLARGQLSLRRTNLSLRQSVADGPAQA